MVSSSKLLTKPVIAGGHAMPLLAAPLPQLPSISHLVRSPGLAGGLVVLAALILLLAALLATRRETRRLNKQLTQQDQHHREIRADKLRREAIERCWERLTWVVKTAGTEPALDADEHGLGLGPELALAILEGLRSDALALGDTTLAQAVAVYLTQYGLVLGERIGPLPSSLTASDAVRDQAMGDKNGGDFTEAPPEIITSAKASAIQGIQQ